MSMSGCPVCTTPGVVGGLGYVPPVHQVEAALLAAKADLLEAQIRAALIAAARKEQR